MTTKLLPVLLISALLGAVAGALAAFLLAPPTTPVEAGTGVQALERTVAQLAQRLDAVADGVDELRARPGASGAGRVPVGEIDAAVARYLSDHRGAGEEGTGPEAAAADAAAGGPEAAQRTLEEAFEDLVSGDLSWQERQALWTRLGQQGLSDQLVAMFEDRVERDPNDPDLRVELGEAYQQKIFEAGGSTPTAGMWAMKADGAFDAALALDDHHWDARFHKAFSLSMWPPALGMQDKAIAQYEVLLDQQKGQPKSPQFAQTYYYLGNMYQQTGKPEKALQVWQDGFALYPDDPQLAAKLAALKGG